MAERDRVERDEEGRPKATRNAGVFLNPFLGVVPVPSDMIDDYWRRRKGPRRFPLRTLFVIGVIILPALFLLIVVAPALDAQENVLAAATS
jgi:hypothetical protein